MAYTLGPMLAGKYEAARVEKLLKAGPLFAQPKIDGFRLIVWDGVAKSRSWKNWTNQYLQEWARDWPTFTHGWDGEFFVGHQYKPEGFRDTMSGGRSEDGAKELGFYWFDLMDSVTAQLKYADRLELLTEKLEQFGISQHKEGSYHMSHKIIPNHIVTSIEEIEALYQKWLEEGWEGAILRTVNDQYKFGRGTKVSGPLIKMKPVDFAEAQIIRVEPRYRNDNPLERSELGYAKRSSHQENLIPEERVGSFWVRRWDPDTNTLVGEEFKIGVFKGFTLKDRATMWLNKENYPGQFVQFGFQDGGGYDAPRIPVLHAFRNKIEL